MRGRNTCWDAWHESSLDRRDFRDDHGGGPEEMPHRPNKKYKTKHKHVMINGPFDRVVENDRYVLWERINSCECGYNYNDRSYRYKSPNFGWGEKPKIKHVWKTHNSK